MQILVKHIGSVVKLNATEKRLLSKAFDLLANLVEHGGEANKTHAQECCDGLMCMNALWQEQAVQEATSLCPEDAQPVKVKHA